MTTLKSLCNNDSCHNNVITYITLATNYRRLHNVQIYINYGIYFFLLQVNFCLFSHNKMECEAKKNEYFQHLFHFAFNQGSKAAKEADLYSDDFYQQGTGNLVERWEGVVKNNG